MTRKELIELVGAQAKKASLPGPNGKLFPSVTIAQFITESGWKLSNLARTYNNYFGIKAGKTWKGKKVLMKTAEYDKQGNKYYIDDYFRWYDSPAESFKDRANFLAKNKRYVKVLSSKTPFEQADELQKAGYATAPNYASTLKTLITRYDLTKFDSGDEAQNIVKIGIAVLVLGLFFLLLIKLRKK